MAKPSGAITPGDGGLDAQSGTATYTYAYFAFRLPYQAKHWAGDFYTDPRHTVQPSFQYYVAGGNTLREKWYFRATPLMDSNYELGDNDTAAGNGWVVRDETTRLKGRPCNAPLLSDTDTLPRYTWGYVALQEPSSSGGQCEIIGVHIELLDEDTYTAPTPSGALAVELTDRSTVRLYEEDYPASSWHAQWLLCHTYNKMAYENRQCWSVPV